MNDITLSLHVFGIRSRLVSGLWSDDLGLVRSIYSLGRLLPVGYRLVRGRRGLYGGCLREFCRLLIALFEPIFVRQDFGLRKARRVFCSFRLY